MAALLKHIAILLDDPLHSDAIEPVDLIGIGRLYESLSRTDSAIALYERALSNSLPRDLAQRTRQRLSFIQKRRERWPAAIALWREAAAEDEVYACVELAKFYEHHAHDFREATHWTQHALVSVSRPSYPHAARQRWLPELHHRLARLRRRMARSEQPAP
jgi:tetratricopeptide (TPR) repeat protein